MAKQYRFPAPSTLLEGEFARLAKLEVDFRSQRLVLTFVVLTPNGAVAKAASLDSDQLTRLDQFINNADGLPGSTFEEKLLAVLPMFAGDVPSGGTVEDA